MKHALLLVCVVLVACGGSQVVQTSKPGPEPKHLSVGPRAEIERLEAEYDAKRTELALDEPTAPMMEGMGKPMAAPSSTDATCKPAPTDTCKSSCTLSDSICSNATKICKLALDLGDWGAQRCARANATCKAANAKCCGCQ